MPAPRPADSARSSDAATAFPAAPLDAPPRARVRRTAATLAFGVRRTVGPLLPRDGDGDLAEWGIDYLMRQAICIGGGTTEMAMNVISERVLKMPRDATPDRDLPFRDVPRNRTSQG
jgi:hypothetical protein